MPWEDFIQCFIGIVVIVCGLVIGSTIERRHYLALRKREMKARSEVLVTNFKKVPKGYRILSTHFCVGSVVIAADAFKSLVAGLQQLVGGRLETYVTLIDRARREALMRAIEQAQEHGANMLLNVRFETATLGRGGRKQGAVMEVIAYATAMKLEETTIPPEGRWG